MTVFIFIPNYFKKTFKMSLLLISATTAHLQASIHNPVNPAIITRNHHNNNSVFINATLNRQDYQDLRWWGMTPANISQFSDLLPGDEVLFSEKTTGLLNFHGIVDSKMPFPDPALASAIWNSNHENIFILRSVSSRGINKSNFVSALGFRQNYYIQGPNLIRPNNPKFNIYYTIKRRFRI